MVSDADADADADADVPMRTMALDAALAEVQQWGVDRFSIEGVAHRAQLTPEYILQTWESGRQLVIEALRRYSDAMVAVPDTGSLHGDLTELALSLGAYLNEPVGRRIARMMVIDSKSLAVDSDIRVQFWLLQQKTILAIFERAADRGELLTDTKPFLALQLLISPLHTYALYTDLPLEPDLCRAIADLVVRAVRASSPGN